MQANHLFSTINTYFLAWVEIGIRHATFLERVVTGISWYCVWQSAIRGVKSDLISSLLTYSVLASHCGSGPPPNTETPKRNMRIEKLPIRSLPAATNPLEEFDAIFPVAETSPCVEPTGCSWLCGEHYRPSRSRPVQHLRRHCRHRVGCDRRFSAGRPGDSHQQREWPGQGRNDRQARLLSRAVA